MKKIFIVTLTAFLVLLFLRLLIKQPATYEELKLEEPEILVQENPLTVEFNPPSGNLEINSPHVIALTLTTTGSNKISGFDMTLLAAGGFQITAVGDPQATQGTPTFTEIVKGSIPANSVKLVYVIDELEENLPSTVEIEVTIQSTSTGQGTLKIDTTDGNYQFVGPNPLVPGDYLYEISASEGTYDFVGSAPTPTPLTSPLIIEAENIVGLVGWQEACGNIVCHISNNPSTRTSSLSFSYSCPATHTLQATVEKGRNRGSFTVTSSFGQTATINLRSESSFTFPTINLLTGLGADSQTITIQATGDGYATFDKFILPAGCTSSSAPTPTTTPTPYYTPTPTIAPGYGSLDGFTWVFEGGDIMPVGSANVSLYKDGALVTSTTSDVRAYYRWLDVEPGTYTMIGRVFHWGHWSSETKTDVVVNLGQNTRVILLLMPEY